MSRFHTSLTFDDNWKVEEEEEAERSEIRSEFFLGGVVLRITKTPPSHLFLNGQTLPQFRGLSEAAHVSSLLL